MGEARYGEYEICAWWRLEMVGGLEVCCATARKMVC